MFSKTDSAPAEVRGSLLHQDGRDTLPSTTLSSEGQKPLIATFSIDDEGNVTLR